MNATLPLPLDSVLGPDQRIRSPTGVGTAPRRARARRARVPSRYWRSQQLVASQPPSATTKRPRRPISAPTAKMSAVSVTSRGIVGPRRLSRNAAQRCHHSKTRRRTSWPIFLVTRSRAIAARCFAVVAACCSFEEPQARRLGVARDGREPPPPEEGRGRRLCGPSGRRPCRRGAGPASWRASGPRSCATACKRSVCFSHARQSFREKLQGQGPRASFVASARLR